MSKKQVKAIENICMKHDPPFDAPAVKRLTRGEWKKLIREYEIKSREMNLADVDNPEWS